MSERKLIWKRVDGNPLWLRGRMSRILNPKSFHESMTPERNALITDPQFKAVLSWIKETDADIRPLPDGILAFTNEEDMTMFLLRWT